MTHAEKPTELIGVKVLTTDLEALQLASITSGKPVAEYMRDGIRRGLRELFTTEPAFREALDERIAAYGRFLLAEPEL